MSIESWQKTLDFQKRQENHITWQNKGKKEKREREKRKKGIRMGPALLRGSCQRRKESGH